MIDIASLPDVTRELSADGLALLGAHLTDEVRRYREDPMTFGHPLHAGQERVVASSCKRKLVVASNRVGKTECAMREGLWRARGNHPYRNLRPHNTIWIGCPDYPSYLRYTKPAFEAWCPKSWMIGDLHETDKYVEIRRLDGGVCTIFFLSYDMPRSKWQGAAVDWMWLDEEMPEDLYGEAMTRTVSVKGEALLTFTPLSGMGWWYDRLFIPGRLPHDNPDWNGWDVIQMQLATRDPSRELEIGEPMVPHFTREMVLDFARLYPDETERAIRVFGEVRGRTGVIYKGYDSAIHVIPTFEIPSHWEVWAATDPGHHGFAALFFAISPAGRVYVFHEYFSQDEATSVRFAAMGAVVMKLRAAQNVSALSVVPDFVDCEDPQVVLELNIQAAQSNTPIAFASLAMGLKAVKAGIMRVQQMLMPNPALPTPAEVKRERPLQGEPLVYIMDNLVSTWRDADKVWEESRLLWEMTRYLWKKPPKGSTVQPDEPDKASGGGAHMLDTFRMGIMARFGPGEEIKEEKYPKAGKDSWVWEHLDDLEEQMMQGDEE